MYDSHRPRRFPRILLALIVVAAVSPADAWAYIDAGTGSLLIQGLIAAVLGAGVALRVFWHKLFGRGGDPDPDPDRDADE